ncbi:MAG: class I SAM-dependent methyltransferase [Polyangiales bacterium]
MSEDPGESDEARRRRSTRAGRRSAHRMPEGVLHDSWPPDESARAAERDAGSEASPPELGDELSSAEQAASEGRCDTMEMPAEAENAVEAAPHEGDALDPATLIEVDAPVPVADDEKTLPRIRLDDYAPLQEAIRKRRDSDPHALTDPRIAIAGLGFSDAPPPSESSVVVMAPARIISDPPQPAPEHLDAFASIESAGHDAPEPVLDFEALGEPEPTHEESDQDQAEAADALQVDIAALEVAAAPEAEIEDSGLQVVDFEVLATTEPPGPGRTPPPPPPTGPRADAVSVPPGSRPKPPPPTGPRADAVSAPPGTRPKPPPPPSAPKPDEGQKRKQARQWWERFFSDDYLMTVRPPTAAQIAKQVDFVEASLGLARGAIVLDVGCGLGQHAIELSRRGYLVVGLDLSLAMITRAAEAAQQLGLKINFVHADIREMEFDGAFDAAICMGTTLGFFDEEANRDMLTRLYNALKPGGRLLIDVVNRDYVIGAQPNLVWFEGDGCVCMEESDFNYFNSRLTVKRTMMREDGRQANAEYSLRLYSLHDLGQLMQQSGFRVIEVSGQEAIRGAFFGVQSPRILMLAERRLPGRASAAMAQERGSAEVARPSAVMPPERASAELPKPPKSD